VPEEEEMPAGLTVPVWLAIAGAIAGTIIGILVGVAITLALLKRREPRSEVEEATPPPKVAEAQEAAEWRYQSAR
jgi:Na+/glutamate symporter